MPDEGLELDFLSGEPVRGSGSGDPLVFEGLEPPTPEVAKEDPKVELEKAKAYAKALEESLKISEDARKHIQTQPVQVQVQPQPEQPRYYAPQIPEMPSAEQIQEAFEKNPGGTLQYLTQLVEARTRMQHEQRLGPMLQSHSTTAEALARQKYPEEFELFGPEILDAIRRLPDPALAASLDTWDNVISWSRGRTGNIDKLIDKRTKASAAAAQAAQAAANPGHFSGAQRAQGATGGVPVMDEFELMIMKRLEPFTGIKTAEEWNRWKQ